ncbi:MAG TPA: gfo/Idh/MocA family oxidoreductase, partial [Hanamia sp.]
TEGTDIAIGVWDDGRVGTFRGTRTGKHTYGGTAYGEKGDAVLGPFGGYKPLLIEIIKFFETGNPPVNPEDTLEIYAFMEAADESKRRSGAAVNVNEIFSHAKKMADDKLRNLI